MILKTKLYEYQSKAVDKLSKLKVGALYMEQGTGKTRTTLELVNNRLISGKVNAVLWLCPCSVKRNLKEDILKHTGQNPTENNIIIRGIESLSSSDRLYLQLLELVKNYKVYLIVDESNLVKNKLAIRTERIINLSAFCKYKLILNGTPISKNEADLFAQWYILDWRILGYQSFYSFAANHLEYKTVKLPSGRVITTDQIIRVLNVDYLTEKIAPYMYQIKKDEVLRNLKEKEYHTRYFYMEDEQEVEYYETKDIYLFNVVDWRAETIFKLFAALQHITSGRRVLSAPQNRMRTDKMFTWQNNPRIQCLKDVLDEIGEGKCIIFAKYQDEIVDGFHRYSIMLKYKDIYEREKGMLPVSVVNKPIGERMASTIRHNRARGSHDVDLMSNIVKELKDMGKTDKWIMKHLGMDADEVIRLKQMSGLASLFGNEEFSNSWDIE